MEKEPTCEQVGFVHPVNGTADLRLQMAGGEFCGNASLCAAAWFAMLHEIKPGQQESVKLEVSGSSAVLSAEIHCLKTTDTLEYEGSIQMPVIQDIHPICFAEGEYPVVFMPGILHAIVPESFGREKALNCIRRWCKQLNAACLGIMLLSSDSCRITPLVYVPGSDTLVWEQSCASGTAAVGAWLAAKEKRALSRSFTEPGGSLSVEAAPNGQVILHNQIKLIRHQY
ncbi:MAG: hypothetical protein MJ075_03090 [Oscillospiraceae bacterium]|nr:hypothetical protein [Oscillospiraceae bacterium]